MNSSIQFKNKEEHFVFKAYVSWSILSGGIVIQYGRHYNTSGISKACLKARKLEYYVNKILLASILMHHRDKKKIFETVCWLYPVLQLKEKLSSA